MSAVMEKSLSGIAIFEGLEEAEIRQIQQKCRWREYRANQEILASGSESQDVFFVVNGSVNIVNFSMSGREVSYANLTAGDCFGELAALDGQPRSATVVASEKSLLAMMCAKDFIDLLKRRVEVTFRVLQRLTQMVRSGDVRIMELSTFAAAHRVYAELLRIAQPDAAVPGLWVVRPLPPLREIASRVSTTRETVARAMSQLYPTGLVRRKGRNLYLLDRAKLEEKLRAIQLETTRRSSGF